MWINFPYISRCTSLSMFIYFHLRRICLQCWKLCGGFHDAVGGCGMYSVEMSGKKRSHGWSISVRETSHRPTPQVDGYPHLLSPFFPLPPSSPWAPKIRGRVKCSEAIQLRYHLKITSESWSVSEVGSESVSQASTPYGRRYTLHTVHAHWQQRSKNVLKWKKMIHLLLNQSLVTKVHFQFALPA